MNKLINEEWLSIEGYSNYMISNQGNVLNKRTGKAVSQCKNYSGYLFCCLKSDNGKWNTKQVHRLVAKAFIPNPENKPTVDHINMIKTDNRVDNLRWQTHKEQLNNPDQDLSLKKGSTSEKYRANQKAYRDSHKEELKSYYDAHKEEIKSYLKAYRDSHKEEIKSYLKAYRDSHKEEIKSYLKAYRESSTK